MARPAWADAGGLSPSLLSGASPTAAPTVVSMRPLDASLDRSTAGDSSTNYAGWEPRVPDLSTGKVRAAGNLGWSWSAAYAMSLMAGYESGIYPGSSRSAMSRR
jgi:hypothetical protein